ncbi:hypothetical protein [Micromonospora purpureochromogenes]|uniref:hypothetical protein n=1 Tax=Micromonospora purpureochromogenes TaxID=47872 RepID=UPI0012FDD29E|nr:hypothetical protein [Micromonospora purpureochromogenes]
MRDLVNAIIEAHGGLDRYQQFSSATAHFRSGGALWAIKGHEGIFNPAAVRVDLRREHASHYPFKAPDLHTSFTAQRVAVESDTGEVKAERLNPRASFAGHVLETPWDDLDVAYFRRLRHVDVPDVPVHLREARLPYRRAVSGDGGGGDLEPSQGHVPR